MVDPVTDIIDELLTDPSQIKVNSHGLVQQSPEEIALVLESLPIEQRVEAWHQLPESILVDVLVCLRGEAGLLLLNQLSQQEQEALFTEIDADDLIELVDSIPDRLMDFALERMDVEQRKFFTITQQYDYEQVGYNADQNIVVVSQRLKVKEAKRVLLRSKEAHTDLVFLIDRGGRYSGSVSVRELLTSPEHLPVSDLTLDDIDVLAADSDVFKAVDLVERSDFDALPIIDKNSVLMGRLHIADCLSIIREDLEAQLMAQSGMTDDLDLFAPVVRSARTRALWLGINLITVVIASAFISLFEATLQQVVALAVLMPIVASMGGIAGSQSLALIIRGLSLGQVTQSNLKLLIIKETRVGLLNGAIWALVIALMAGYWFASPMIGVVIGIAVLANIAVACCLGVVTPVLLDKMSIDPALSGSVILTTFTDIIGFVAFLGLGTLFLL